MLCHCHSGCSHFGHHRFGCVKICYHCAFSLAVRSPESLDFTNLCLRVRLQGPLLLFNLVSAVACLGQGPLVSRAVQDRPFKRKTSVGLLFLWLRARAQGPVDLTFPTMPFIIGFLTLSLLLASQAQRSQNKWQGVGASSAMPMAHAARFRLTGAQSRASRAYDLWDDVLSICRTRASALSRAVSGV